MDISPQQKNYLRKLVVMMAELLPCCAMALDERLNLIQAGPHAFLHDGRGIHNFPPARTGDRAVWLEQNAGLCDACPQKAGCTDQAALLAPIVNMQDAPLGWLGLVAGSPAAADWLVKKQAALENLLCCLGRLSTLEQQLTIEDRKSLVAGETLSTLLHMLAEGVILTDSRLEITMINDSARRCLACDPKTVSLTASLAPEVRRKLYNTHGGIEVLTIAGPLAADKSPHRVLASSLFVDGERAGNILVIDPATPDQGAMPQAKYSFDSIIGSSQVMENIKLRAKKVCAINTTILLQGESGTGKELFAQAIHLASPRCHRPFVAINCAAIPDTLLESELFGYEEGAFSGARRGGKPGKFELANGGTLFFDEVGEFPVSLQAKLLRAMETRQVQRLGGVGSVPVDVRIIAATNRNLEELIAQQRFREDLYFRLNVIPLYVPPLRERKEDLYLILELFFKRLCLQYGKPMFRLSSEVLTFLFEYDWPGNVREAENVIEYVVITANSSFITIEDLPPKLIQKARQRQASSAPAASYLQLKQLEREVLVKTLERCGMDLEGKKTAAATLGISLATLYRKIKHYSL